MEILDSRANPTVLAKVTLCDGSVGCASVPSGASTGEFEALELRDGGERYMGKGVLTAVSNINTVIKQGVMGEEINDLRELDSKLIAIDGTENKEKLGANATLAVSIAFANAAAKYHNMPLYRYIGGVYGSALPTPMMNIINGGAHANNNVDIQEFMLMPTGFGRFHEKLEASVRVYHNLKNLIKGSTAVGDEGGFAPNLEKDEDALDLICNAVEKTGYKMKEHFSLAIDAASSEWYSGKSYILPKSNKQMSTDELIGYWENLCDKYPIISIEDGLSENDWEGWQKLTQKLGGRIQLVGDDLFVTNTKRLKTGIEKCAGNAILIKPNQIGTLTETMDAILLAQKNGYKTIISHRSGETKDTTIADLAVATNAGQIKTGAPARSDRAEKYNRLLEIEKEIYNI
ncbi:MAG: phosphopyruvate hydratase [Clostridia bacterium]|nr:phosphopyruvate hydratase [Clostridia bacterium]